MTKIAKLTKSRAIIIAGIIALAVGLCFCLNSPRTKARGHFRILALGEMKNVRYECDGNKRRPAYYIGADNVDAKCLQKIVDKSSLEKRSFFLYPGSNPPDWWPEEIAGRGSRDEIKHIGADLRASGDLVTYRFDQKPRGSSFIKFGQKTDQRYIIELYYFPKKKQLFYVKRIVDVVTP